MFGAPLVVNKLCTDHGLVYGRVSFRWDIHPKVLRQGLLAFESGVLFGAGLRRARRRFRTPDTTMRVLDHGGENSVWSLRRW